MTLLHNPIKEKQKTHPKRWFFDTIKRCLNLKQKYRMSTIAKKWKVTNWRQYNKGLIDRGNITLMIDWDDLHKIWYAESIKKNGSPFTYSDIAIETTLTIGALFNFPLRQTQGCVASLFSMMNVPYDIPSYVTLSRRGEKLTTTIKTKKKEAIILAIDSTGLKVFGEGEWKVRKHGYAKRRTWKKFHVGIDHDGEIRTFTMTDSHIHDTTQTENLLCENMTGFLGDGNDHVNEIQRTSLQKWKRRIGYQRSRVEVTMFRYKNTFGQRLRARKDATQKTEILIRCNLLNRFRDLSWAIYKAT